jgi:hypothetical protein
MKEIDLSLKPESNSPMGMAESRPLYPSFHYSGEKDLDLPMEGTMTVQFCITRKTSTETDTGKHHYSCDIDLKKITNVKSEVSAPTKRDTSAEDALDKLAEEKSKEKGY